MSEGLQRRLAAEESREAMEAAREERVREQLVEERQSRAVVAAIQEAVARGEYVDMPRALRGEGLGHTPGEFVAQRAALMDVEDMQTEARERAEFRKWHNERSADLTHDTSEVEGEVIANRAYVAERLPALKARQAARRDAQKIAQAVVARGRR
jgi:hypothetical protein